jgi:hypothetical protein
MPEPQKAARFNITIPPGLKARMEAAPPTENWSAVAARAFEQRLLELDAQKETKTMNDVIARLKAAAEIEANENYQAGFEAGEAWAKGRAKPSQLRRLARYIALCGLRGEDWLSDPDRDQFARAVLGLGKMDDDEAVSTALEFWCDVIPYDDETDQEGAELVQDDDFFRGFGEGAAALWEKVKDKL